MPALAHAQSADLVLSIASPPILRSRQAGRREGVAEIAGSESQPRSNTAGSPQIVATGDVPARPRRRSQPADGRKRSRPGARRPTRARHRRWSSSACSTVPAPASPGTRRRRANCSSARPRPAIRAASAISRRSAAAPAASDPARARELLSKTAETNAEAQYQLGMMLSEGKAAPRMMPRPAPCSRRRRRKTMPARWSGWARSRRQAAAGRRIPMPQKPITSVPRRSATRMPRKRWSGCDVPIDQGQARQCRDQSVLLADLERALWSWGRSPKTRKQPHAQ